MVKCKVKGCNTTLIEAKGYCIRHYTQKTRGPILRRTKFDLNEIILNKTKHIAYIILYNIKNQEIARTIIDLEDLNKVKNYKWGLINKKYVWNSKNKIYLHNLIMNRKWIDYINGNPLDNRRCNLRKCTQSQNSINQKIRNTNTSGYKGVYWDKIYNTWNAQIGINYKVINLGRFKKLEDAIKARKEAEIKYFKEFRRLT